jgi:hypothetical protein
MGTTAEERMTTEIDRTRQDLSRDVDALYDKVSPGRVMERRKAAVRGRVSSLRDSVMGSAQQATGSAQGAAHGMAESASGAASAVQHSAGDAVHAIERRAEGSPLGAGLVAFGAGMVIAALIPPSQKEAELAGQLTDAVKSSPLVDEAKAAGQEIGENLKQTAADAAQEVKQTAQDAAQQVSGEGQDAARHVRDDAPGG